MDIGFGGRVITSIFIGFYLKSPSGNQSEWPVDTLPVDLIRGWPGRQGASAGRFQLEKIPDWGSIYSAEGKNGSAIYLRT
jgi:hypothetical protein